MTEPERTHAATALAEAIATVGGGAALAQRLAERGAALTRQAIYQWGTVPPRHVIAVEEITGVSRHRLRPDLYPPPAREDAA